MKLLTIIFGISLIGVNVSYASVIDQSLNKNTTIQVPSLLKTLTDAQMDDFFRQEENRTKQAAESVKKVYEQLAHAKDAYKQLRQNQSVILNGAIALERERLQNAQAKLDELKKTLNDPKKKGFLARFDFRSPVVQSKAAEYLNNYQKEVDAHEKRLSTLLNAQKQANELDTKVLEQH